MFKTIFAVGAGIGAIVGGSTLVFFKGEMALSPLLIGVSIGSALGYGFSIIIDFYIEPNPNNTQNLEKAKSTKLQRSIDRLTGEKQRLLEEKESYKSNSNVQQNIGGTDEKIPHATSSKFTELVVDFLKCPITQMTVEDPVTLKCTHTFERNALLTWYLKGEDTCPTCRETTLTESPAKMPRNENLFKAAQFFQKGDISKNDKKEKPDKKPSIS